MTRKLEAAIDQSVCVGSQNCTYVAPGTFRVEEDGKTYAIVPAGDDETAIMDAAVECPVQAITVRDVETGEVVHP